MTKKHFTTPLTPELCCSNIKASLHFYIEILGFKIQYAREEDGFAMLERQGARIMLDEIKNHNNAATGRTWLSGEMEKPFGRGINLEIKTLNVEQLYQRACQSGTTIFLPIEEKWYRAENIEIGNRQFIVLDPDGYMLRFAEELGERKTVSLKK